MIKDLIERYPQLKVCEDDVIKAIRLIEETYQKGGKLLLCGNGGSAADCEHIVGELMKSFMKKRRLSEEKKAKMKKNCPEIDDSTLEKLEGALPAVSLCSTNALNTAFSNDKSATHVFAQSVLGLGKEGDTLIAISTSGRSSNVVEAAKVARAIKMRVISLTGEGGGELRTISDVCIAAPQTETYLVQELHLPIYHHICKEIENTFFD